MKTLIAVAGCNQPVYQGRWLNQCLTWIPHQAQTLPDVDVRLFTGRGTSKPMCDEVRLNCPDSYPERKKKVKAIFCWALENGYDRLVKIDDDTYVRPERLASLEEIDYGGFRMQQKFMDGPKFLYERETILGAFYVMSRKAMRCCLEPDLHPEVPFEDCWVSLQLVDSGIAMVDLRPRLGYEFYNGDPAPSWFDNHTPPKPDNNIVASWEYRTFTAMDLVHKTFLSD